MSRVASLHPAHHGAAMVDAHTPIHLLVGFAAGVLGVNTYLAVLCFVGAKVIDQALHAGPHAILKRGEGQSVGNELGDLVFEMSGFFAGEKLLEKLQPAPTAGLGRLQLQPYVGFNATLYPNGSYP